MAFPNVSDIVATTIENRSKKLADNVLKNNALLTYLRENGHVTPFGGGSVIFQELMFAENANASFYSGYDLLPVAAQDVLSAAQYNIKQAAVPVVISGLEQIQNSSREAMIDLMEGRLSVAEKSLYNLIAQGIYSDGTGFGGKQIDGLDAAVPVNPATGTYGGIPRGTWTFWRSKIQSGTTLTASNIQHYMNVLYVQLVRGTDKPTVTIFDNNFFTLFLDSLQPIQRFTDPKKAELGFRSVAYMAMDVILDGGIGGFCPANTGFMLNLDYLHYRPHRERNMVPLNPNRRYAINQDAEVQMIGWAGNLTTSGAQFQGRLTN